MAAERVAWCCRLTTWAFRIPHILLATSTCISAAINTALLWRGLVKAGVYQPKAGLGRAAGARRTRECVDGGAARLDGRRHLPSWLAAPPLQRAAHLAVCVVAALPLYFAALFVCGVRLRHMRSAASA